MKYILLLFFLAYWNISFEQNNSVINIYKGQIANAKSEYILKTLPIPEQGRYSSIKKGMLSSYYSYIFSFYKERTNLADEVFDSYNFIVNNMKTGKKVSFQDILGVWIVESSLDGSKLTVPIKKASSEQLSCGSLFLVQNFLDTLQIIPINLNVCNYTNAIFFNYLQNEMIVYINDDNLCFYNIEQKKEIFKYKIILNMSYKQRNLLLKINNFANNNLSLKLFFTNLEDQNTTKLKVANFNVHIPH